MASAPNDAEARTAHHVRRLHSSVRDLQNGRVYIYCSPRNGVQLVYISMGRDGLSGAALSVAPGRSACLQCLEKRKMLKLSGGGGTVSIGGNTDGAPAYAIGLPTTECVLAGIAVQHAFAHLLGAGSICSRVEYDEFREKLDRSGFVAPVHLCPSVHCRQQQQHHHHQHQPPPTASTALQ